MTVQSPIARIQFAGNDVATNFAFPNLFFLDTDLVVTLTDTATGVDTTQIITTDYTVTGAGNPSGGTVSFVVAPPTGQTITIARILDATQLIDYIPNDSFPAETHERGLDKLTMLIQQLLGLNTSSLAIQFPLTEPAGTNNILPSVIDRANKVVAFDSNGNVVAGEELGDFQGDYVGGRDYNERDLIRDPATSDVYIATRDFTASGSIATDVTNGDLLLLFLGPSPVGVFRGDYTTATAYNDRELIRDPTSKDIFIATQNFVSTTFAADVTAGKLVLFIDVPKGGASRGVHTPGTDYFVDDLVKDPLTDDIYIVLNNYTAGASVAIDVAAGNLQRFIPASPVGSLMWWPKSVAPIGWLERDGSAISRTTFSDLFGVLGTDYGIGDGSTTFNLPDDRGQFIRGHDNGAGVDPDAGSRTDRGDGTTGDNVGTLQGGTVESHLHSASVSGFVDSAGSHTHSLSGMTTSVNRTDTFDVTAGTDATMTHISGSLDSITGSMGSAGAHTHTLSGTTVTIGSTGGNETRSLNRAYLPIIKF